MAAMRSYTFESENLVVSNIVIIFVALMK